jgi:hypothetical protein
MTDTDKKIHDAILALLRREYCEGPVCCSDEELEMDFEETYSSLTAFARQQRAEAAEAEAERQREEFSGYIVIVEAEMKRQREALGKGVEELWSFLNDPDNQDGYDIERLERLEKDLRAALDEEDEE